MKNNDIKYFPKDYLNKHIFKDNELKKNLNLKNL